MDQRCTLLCSHARGDDGLRTATTTLTMKKARIEWAQVRDGKEYFTTLYAFNSRDNVDARDLPDGGLISLLQEELADGNVIVVARTSDDNNRAAIAIQPDESDLVGISEGGHQPLGFSYSEGRAWMAKTLTIQQNDCSSSCLQIDIKWTSVWLGWERLDVPIFTTASAQQLEESSTDGTCIDIAPDLSPPENPCDGMDEATGAMEILRVYNECCLPKIPLSCPGEIESCVQDSCGGQCAVIDQSTFDKCGCPPHKTGGTCEECEPETCKEITFPAGEGWRRCYLGTVEFNVNQCSLIETEKRFSYKMRVRFGPGYVPQNSFKLVKLCPSV